MPTLLMARKKREGKGERLDLRVSKQWLARVQAEAVGLGLSVAAYLRLAASEKMDRDQRGRAEGST